MALFQQDMGNQQLIIGAALGLLVGGAGGFFAGSYTATQSINEQVAAEEAARAAEAGASAVRDVETNPFEGVKFNPFE